MALEPVLDGHELVVDLRHAVLERGDRLRVADARHHVLALRVDEELAEEAALAIGRIARETDTRPGALAEVAEHHRHDGDGGAPVVGQPVDAPVIHGLLGEPGVEDGADRELELLGRILRERLARARLDELFELGHEGLERLRLEVGIGLRVGVGFRAVQQLVEGAALDAEHDVAEDGDEAPVAVPREALVLGPSSEPDHGPIVQPEIQHGIHHAGHGRARA